MRARIVCHSLKQAPTPRVLRPSGHPSDSRRPQSAGHHSRWREPCKTTSITNRAVQTAACPNLRDRAGDARDHCCLGGNRQLALISSTVFWQSDAYSDSEDTHDSKVPSEAGPTITATVLKTIGRTIRRPGSDESSCDKNPYISATMLGSRLGRCCSSLPPRSAMACASSALKIARTWSSIEMASLAVAGESPCAAPDF